MTSKFETCVGDEWIVERGTLGWNADCGGTIHPTIHPSNDRPTSTFNICYLLVCQLFCGFGAPFCSAPFCRFRLWIFIQQFHLDSLQNTCVEFINYFDFDRALMFWVLFCSNQSLLVSLSKQIFY